MQYFFAIVVFSNTNINFSIHKSLCKINLMIHLLYLLFTDSRVFITRYQYTLWFEQVLTWTNLIVVLWLRSPVSGCVHNSCQWNQTFFFFIFQISWLWIPSIHKSFSFNCLAHKGEWNSQSMKNTYSFGHWDAYFPYQIRW